MCHSYSADIDEVEEDYHFSVSLSESEEDGADEDLRERLHTGLSGLMLELEGEVRSLKRGVG